MVHSTKPPWYRTRRYVHFDHPLLSEQATVLVSDPERVAKHSFWPLLSFHSRVRRWSRAEGRFKKKVRPIAYAAHSDAHIFAYYSFQLGLIYEESLRTQGLEDVVLAYRRHVRAGGKGKANYHFAADAFASILDYSECDVVAIDIAKFFDRIPHKQLKEQWKRLLQVSELPPDHYSVYKAATQFAAVPLAQVRKKCNIGRRAMRELSRLPISGRQFRERIRGEGLIDRNIKNYGIPQGLPISGLLANLVMLDVDRAMHETACSVDGSYRRYSDDILLICPPDRTDELEVKLESALAELALEMQNKKRVFVRFRQDSNGVLRADVPLQYLGFTFDGRRVLVRPQTITRFHKRIHRAVIRAKNAAKKSGPESDGRYRIQRRSLYARFSHLGPHRTTPPEKIPPSTFLKYVDRSDAATDRTDRKGLIVSRIKRQLRPVWNYLQKEIAAAENELNGGGH